MSKKVIVTVNEGKVRGFKTKTAYSQTEYYAFLGVPYGQPTNGPARFKDPVKVKPWNNTLDATIEKKGCVQFSLRHRIMIGSEDCLYNNIYTPEIPSSEDALRAVIVNVHPGGNIHGSPDPSYYGAPDFVMHHNIVYVCVGYRLHVKGHLNLNMKHCSGNQGIKDIILGLQWIKENIHAFGGDPGNVTLMGSSSGAYGVHSVLLSPLAQGLYHKAILMGMYVFCPVVALSEENDTIAYEIAKAMGYSKENPDNRKLLNFYNNLNFDEVFFMTERNQAARKASIQVYPASPFISNAQAVEDSPQPRSPRELLPSTNRVPILIGFCQREASVGMYEIRKLNAYIDIELSITASNVNDTVKNHSGWAAHLADDELKKIQNEVENFYLDGESIENASQSTLCDILTDAALSDVYDTLINVVSRDFSSSVYVYNFYYDGKLCTMKAYLERLMENKLEGAFHAADYSYWCYNEELAGKNMGRIQPKDRKMIDTFTTILTNFAKTSNPNYEGMTVNWKPTTPVQPSHLIINEELESRDEILNGKRLEFWHDLKKRFEKQNNNL